MAISISISTHIPVVVRPADGQEPLDRGAHHKEDGAAHCDPEYKGIKVMVRRVTGTSC